MSETGKRESTEQTENVRDRPAERERGREREGERENPQRFVNQKCRRKIYMFFPEEWLPEPSGTKVSFTCVY